VRRSSKAELQMLREYAWLMLPTEVCYFCKGRLLTRDSTMTFGHRRHGPILVKVSVHHRDHNRANNTQDNLRLAHKSCHQKYHAEVNSGDRSKSLVTHS
jgi:hypothetical protein